MQPISYLFRPFMRKPSPYRHLRTQFYFWRGVDMRRIWADNEGMFRTKDDMKALRRGKGANIRQFADLLGVSQSTVKRWEADGVPEHSDTRTREAIIRAERDVPPNPKLATARERIAGALPDLPDADLAEILADVKRRQLAALSREFGQGEAEPDPDAVQDRARRSADNDGPNQANAG